MYNKFQFINITIFLLDKETFMSNNQVMNIHPNIRSMSVVSYGGIDDPKTDENPEGTTQNLTGSFHVINFTNTEGVVYRACVDIGAHQGSDIDDALNGQVEVIPDAVVITHAHMDHIGRLPVLWKHLDFHGKIYMGHLTKLVGTEALLDAAGILEKKYDELKGPHDRMLIALKEAIKVKNKLQIGNNTGNQTRAPKNKDAVGNNMRITDTPPRKKKGQVYTATGTEGLKISIEKMEQILAPYGGSLEAWNEAEQPAPPIFKKNDVLSMMEEVISLPDGVFTDILPGVGVRPYNAGHVLGSKSILFSIQKGAKKQVYAYFSGDLGSYKWPTKPAGEIEVPGSDFPLIFAATESTYGNTVREDFEFGMAQMEKDINNAALKKLASVFACFSLDRAQRVLHELLMLQKKNEWTFPIYLDSPLATVYTALYAIYAADEGFQGSMKLVDVITSKEMREEIFLDKKFRVIITSSGMAQGGPIRTYLPKWLQNSQVEFSFPGYMAHGTDGWKLTAKEKPEFLEFKMESKKKGANKDSTDSSESSVSTVQLKVNAKINHYTHFSGHADEKDLLRWYTSLPKAPGMKFSIVHGVRKGASRLFRETMQRKGIDVKNVKIPKLKEEVVVF